MADWYGKKDGKGKDKAKPKPKDKGKPDKANVDTAASKAAPSPEINAAMKKVADDLAARHARERDDAMGRHDGDRGDMHKRHSGELADIAKRHFDELDAARGAADGMLPEAPATSGGVTPTPDTAN